jgi:hypothetical protein
MKPNVETVEQFAPPFFIPAPSKMRLYDPSIQQRGILIRTRCSKEHRRLFISLLHASHRVIFNSQEQSMKPKPPRSNQPDTHPEAPEDLVPPKLSKLWAATQRPLIANMLLFFASMVLLLGEQTEVLTFLNVPARVQRLLPTSLTASIGILIVLSTQGVGRALVTLIKTVRTGNATQPGYIQVEANRASIEQKVRKAETTLSRDAYQKRLIRQQPKAMQQYLANTYLRGRIQTRLHGINGALLAAHCPAATAVAGLNSNPGQKATEAYGDDLCAIREQRHLHYNNPNPDIRRANRVANAITPFAIAMFIFSVTFAFYDLPAGTACFYLGLASTRVGYQLRNSPPGYLFARLRNPAWTAMASSVLLIAAQGNQYGSIIIEFLALGAVVTCVAIWWCRHATEPRFGNVTNDTVVIRFVHRSLTGIFGLAFIALLDEAVNMGHLPDGLRKLDLMLAIGMLLSILKMIAARKDTPPPPPQKGSSEPEPTHPVEVSV